MQHNLSIRIFADGFSFFVTQVTSGELVLREDYKQNGSEEMHLTLLQMLARPTMQQHLYHRVTVVVESDTTCVPMQEFDADSSAHLYQMVFSEANMEGNAVCHILLPQLEVAEVFAVPRQLFKSISNVYPEARFVSTYVLATESVMQLSRTLANDRQPLFAIAQGHRLFLFSIQQDKLLYANSFPIEGGENTLFFLLSVWKELGLDAKENPCYIGGDEELSQRLLREAGEFIVHCKECAVRIR